MKHRTGQLLLALAVLFSLGIQSTSQQTQQGPPTSLPWAWVSFTTVKPTALQLDKSNGRVVLTASIFHQGLPKGQTESVTLEVGTGLQDPQVWDPKVIYRPANQTVHLSGDSGVVDAKVEVSVPPCPPGRTACSITIIASLGFPSAGITIKDTDPPERGEAKLAITSK